MPEPRSDPPLSAPELLRLAAWFGLLTGFAEVALLQVEKLAFRKLLFVNPHAVWMAPLADVLLFTALGAVLAAASRLRPGLGSLRAASFVFGLAGSLALLLRVPVLHRAAALLLAAGVALQASRLLARRAATIRTLVARTFPAMVALLVVLAVAALGAPPLAEARARAALGPAPVGAPSVLLVVLDTVRAQSLSLYGYELATTPALTRRARRGVVFERAFSTAPWTTPSHRSLFTGRYHHELPRKGGDEASYPTLAEILRDRGYETAGFVANIEYCGRQTGLDRGFLHYEDYPISVAEVVLSAALGEAVANHPRVRRVAGGHDILGRKRAEDLNRDVLGWFARREDRPFFAFLNYYDAHEPYLPPDPFAAAFAGPVPRGLDRIRNWGRQGARWEKHLMSPPEIAAERAAYEGSLAYLDRELERLLEELERRGALDNTIVVITADHGEQFGEHGRFEHHNSLYRQALQVPLVITFPARVPAGERVSVPVTLRSVGATVLDLLGIEDAGMPGTSLSRLWTDGVEAGVAGTDPVLSQFNRAFTDKRLIVGGRVVHTRSLVADGYHYIESVAAPELYDLDADASELHDLARSGEGRAVVERLQRRLAGLGVSHGARAP